MMFYYLLQLFEYFSGNNYVSNDDLIAMALGESGVTTVQTEPTTISTRTTGNF